jgi:L-amino acid N-acyltransferase YncA
MQELIDTCAAVGFRQMIGYIDADNTASLAIHEKLLSETPLVGFGIVGSARRAEQRAWRLTWKLSTSRI